MHVGTASASSRILSGVFLLSNEINVLFVTMQLFEQEGDTDRL
jgi:hypothetical protein